MQQNREGQLAPALQPSHGAGRRDAGVEEHPQWRSLRGEVALRDAAIHRDGEPLGVHGECEVHGLEAAEADALVAHDVAPAGGAATSHPAATRSAPRGAFSRFLCSRLCPVASRQRNDIAGWSSRKETFSHGEE